MQQLGGCCKVAAPHQIEGGELLETLSLEGKTAAVTGGGTGLGKEMALALARAGANVALAGRRPGPLQETAALVEAVGGSALAIPTDVTDSLQVAALFDRTLAEFGKVDVLVNNAGTVGEMGGKPIWEVTDEEFKGGVEANLTGTFYCSRAVARHMVERREGKIINVASGLGLRGGRDNYAYTCAKGAVLQLTRTLAVSLGPSGVTCNCIVPGYFPTGGTAAWSEALPRAEHIPVGRVGDPRELGPIAVFLASSASDYMNGEVFAADGGGLAGGYAPTDYAPAVALEL